MFIKNSFQTTALTWILSLGKKPDLLSGKNRFAMEKPSGHFDHADREKNIALRDGLRDVKDYFFFIEGACDRFLSRDFPVLAQNRFTWMENRWESLLS